MAESHDGAGDRALTRYPVPPLPAAAEPAWQAYCAMLESKDQHFEFLRRLDEKRRLGQDRTLAEGAHLETLLSQHDACVGAFTRAMQDLARSDAAARAALVEAITQANQALGADEAAD